MVISAFTSSDKKRGMSSPDDMMFLYYLMTLSAKCLAPSLHANIDRKHPPEDLRLQYGGRFARAFNLSDDEADACGRMFFAVSDERVTAAYCVDRLHRMCATDTKLTLMSASLPAFLDDGELYNTQTWHIFGDALIAFCEGNEDTAAEIITPHFMALAENMSLSAGARLRRLHPDVYTASPAHRVFRSGLYRAYESAYTQYRASRSKNVRQKRQAGFSGGVRDMFTRHAKA